uniref:Uncharacterized protein n=1 Tax=Anguilla anguilla TaxID=7936 RepID=A0A0E9U3S8_ANGAN
MLLYESWRPVWLNIATDDTRWMLDHGWNGLFKDI